MHLWDQVLKMNFIEQQNNIHEKVQDYDLAFRFTEFQRFGDIKTKLQARLCRSILQMVRMIPKGIKNIFLDPNHDVCSDAPVRPSLKMIQIESKETYQR